MILTTRKPVLLVGFNKCATTSFQEFFRLNGYNCLGHTYTDEHGSRTNGAKVIFENLQSGRHPFTKLEQFDAFSDLECVTGDQVIEIREHFKEIERSCSDLIFILNTRSKDDWLRSRREHFKGRYIAHYRRIWNTDNESIVARWSQQWDDHHRAVREELPAEKLFEFNADNPDVAGLCRFLNVPIIERMPQKNVSAKGALSLKAQNLFPVWIKRTVPDSVKTYLKKY